MRGEEGREPGGGGGSPAILTDQIPERDLSVVGDDRFVGTDRWDTMNIMYRNEN
jgi:hypothetical protein